MMCERDSSIVRCSPSSHEKKGDLNFVHRRTLTLTAGAWQEGS